jgi:hypothetical protein
LCVCALARARRLCGLVSVYVSVYVCRCGCESVCECERVRARLSVFVCDHLRVPFCACR